MPKTDRRDALAVIAARAHLLDPGESLAGRDLIELTHPDQITVSPLGAQGLIIAG